MGTLLRTLKETFTSPNYLFGALGTFPKAIAMGYSMQEAGVTHVHAHFANHPALVAYVIHRMTGIPYTFTAHGSDIHVDQTALALKIESAKHAVMISEYNADFVANACGEALRPKLKVIRCGIDPTLFQRDPATQQQKRFEILCVAALRGVKGHRFLIEACAHLAAEGIDFHCHLVGGGPLLRSLEEQVEAWQIADRVTLHGAQPRPQVIQRMLNADVVVLPSVQDKAGRREGIPVTLMEAMSCETAVVASRISGIPELVEDGVSGRLVTPGDGRALAQALLELARDPELRRSLGREGRQAVLENYELSQNVAELVTLFESKSSVG